LAIAALPRSLSSAALSPPLAMAASSFLSTSVSMRLTKKLATDALREMSPPFFASRSSPAIYALATAS
jgi:hypothetical protein